MVLESNVTNNCLVISFNSPKTSNSISADDWKELKEKIKEFEKSDTKYLVLNRVNDRRYPNTICEVVHQGKQKPSWKDPNKMVMVRDACQFSWYCDGKKDDPQDEDRWMEAQLIAYNMIEHGKFRGITEGATHYHATYVNPSWARTLQQVGRLGAHIFYRWE